MQKFLIITLLCLFGFSASAQEPTRLTASAQEPTRLTAKEQALLEKDLDGVLRGFIWGLPPTAILENEKGTFVGEENGALFYLDYIRGIRCTIGYEFDDNKLWRARIFVEKQYSDPQERIRDLLTIQTDLNKRFGQPVSENFKWLEDTDKDWPDSWGWAVYRGELFISVKWQTPESDVELKLGAPETYLPEMSIIYENHFVKMAKASAIKDDLLKAP